MNQRPPPQPHAQPQEGMTLVEVLVASMLSVAVVGLAVAVVPRVIAQGAAQAKAAAATVKTTAQTQLVAEQFKDKNFVGFASGSPSALNAVFTTGGAVTVPLQRNLHTLSTLDMPGLSAAVGDQVLLTGGGLGKLVTVTGHPAADTYTLDCPTGLPSSGPVLAYLASTLGLELGGNVITRTTRAGREALGPSTGLHFSYLYASKTGALTRDPAGAPASSVSAGRLSALLPSAQDAGGIDRVNMVPLSPSSLSRLLGCTQMGVTAPNDGQLFVTVGGLPGGVSANATVTGPDPAINGSRPGASRTYTPAQPGTYALTARSVSAGGNVYQPVVSGSPTTLNNSWGSVYLAVQYALAPATLNLSVSGLPAGVGATLTGLPSTIQAGNGTATLRLAAGSYTVAGQPVSAGGVTYSAPAVGVSLAGGGSGSVSVVYSALPGSVAGGSALQVTVTGLPTGAQAGLTGLPSAFYAQNGVYVFSVPAGNYFVGGYSPNMTGGARYTAPSHTVTVPSGGMGNVAVAYVYNRPVGGGGCSPGFAPDSNGNCVGIPTPVSPPSAPPDPEVPAPVSPPSTPPDTGAPPETGTPPGDGGGGGGGGPPAMMYLPSELQSQRPLT